MSVPLGLVRDISADLYTRVTLCSTLLPTATNTPQLPYSKTILGELRSPDFVLCSTVVGMCTWWTRTPFVWQCYSVTWVNITVLQCYMGHTWSSPDLTLIRGLHPPLLNLQFQDTSQAFKAHSTLDSELCPVRNPALREILICLQLPFPSKYDRTWSSSSSLGKRLVPKPGFPGARLICAVYKS